MLEYIYVIHNIQKVKLLGGLNEESNYSFISLCLGFL